MIIVLSIPHKKGGSMMNKKSWTLLLWGIAWSYNIRWWSIIKVFKTQSSSSSNHFSSHRILSTFLLYPNKTLILVRTIYEVTFSAPLPISSQFTLYKKGMQHVQLDLTTTHVEGKSQFFIIVGLLSCVWLLTGVVSSDCIISKILILKGI